MRKKNVLIILMICSLLFSSNAYTKDESICSSCQSTSDNCNCQIKPNAAAAGSVHATAISMACWGLVLIAGMITAVVLISSSTAHSHS